MAPITLPNGLPDLGLIGAKLRAGWRRRAYWQARYRDGRVISEFEQCCPAHKTFDWPELPRRGLVEARLVCPNGEIGVLGNDHGISDRVFQFKVAFLAAGVGRETLAHVLGLVTDTNGTCACYAWEPEHMTPDGRRVVAGRLVRFTDNVERFAYHNLGRLAYDHVGIKPD